MDWFYVGFRIAYLALGVLLIAVVWQRPRPGALVAVVLAINGFAWWAYVSPLERVYALMEGGDRIFNLGAAAIVAAGNSPWERVQVGEVALEPFWTVAIASLALFRPRERHDGLLLPARPGARRRGARPVPRRAPGVRLGHSLGARGHSLRRAGSRVDCDDVAKPDSASLDRQLPAQAESRLGLRVGGGRFRTARRSPTSLAARTRNGVVGLGIPDDVGICGGRPAPG